MAVTTLTAQKSKTSGTALTLSDANTDGSQWTYTGRNHLLVVNGSASSVNVTLAATKAVDGQDIPDHVVAVAASGTAIIRESDIEIDSSGKVQVTYSAVTTVTVALIDAG